MGLRPGMVKSVASRSSTYERQVRTVCAWVQKILRFSKGGFLPPFGQLQPRTSNLPLPTPTGPISRAPASRSNTFYTSIVRSCLAAHIAAQGPPTIQARRASISCASRAAQRTLPALRGSPPRSVSKLPASQRKTAGPGREVRAIRARRRQGPRCLVVG
jgi:hypothetical protein